MQLAIAISTANPAIASDIAPEPEITRELAMESVAQQSSAVATEMNTYLQAHADLGWFSGAAIVVRGEETILAQGYGMASVEHQVPNSAQTKFRIGSITKQFTAAAILQLQDQGLLDVQAPVSTYLPDYPNGDRITLHHLLTHTAGIPNLTSFSDYLEWMQLPTTLDQLIARFQDLPLEFEPGARFSYSNSGYVLLTKVIETVSGQPYADYLEEHLLNPLGLENTGYEHPSAVIMGLASGYQPGDNGYQKAAYINMSVPQGDGGLYSTVADLAQWNRFLFDDQSWDRTVLSDRAIAALTSAQVPMGEEAPDLFYGYGLTINKQPERTIIGHTGAINGFMADLIFLPELDVTIAVLSNLESVSPDHISQDLLTILFGQPYELPSIPEAVAIDPAIYDRYIGTYQVTPQFQVSITVEADRLQIQGTGQPRLTLYPASETEYFSRVVNDFRIRFNLTPDETVESLTLLQSGYETIAPKVE